MRSKHIQKFQKHSSFHLNDAIWLVAKRYFNLGMWSMQIRKTVPFSIISYFRQDKKRNSGCEEIGCDIV